MSTITTSKPLNGLFQVPVGTKLLGEIITWSCSGITIKHLDLIEALHSQWPGRVRGPRNWLLAMRSAGPAKS